MSLSEVLAHLDVMPGGIHILDVSCCLSGMLQKFRSFHPILLTSLTYVLLSYFVHLHCANIHTPLPFLSYDLQNMKTRHSNLFCVKEDL